MSYSLGYYLTQLDTLGIAPDVVAAARELLARPLLPPDFDAHTHDLRAALADGIADGKLSETEIGRRAAEIDARRTDARGASAPPNALTRALGAAGQVRQDRARKLIAKAGTEIDRAFRERADGLRAAIAEAGKTLKAAGVSLDVPSSVAAEARRAGRPAVEALADRDEARAELAELTSAHQEFVTAGLVREMTVARKRAEQRKTEKADAAEQSFGEKARELMTGSAR